MQLEANTYYDCYLEKAELMESKEDEQGRTSLYVKGRYVFPKTGERMDYYHTLIRRDGTVVDFPADRKNPNGPRKTAQAELEERYGVDLSTGEFDNEKLSPDILVRALVVEEVDTWKGKTQKRLRIRGIYQGDNSVRDEPKPQDKRKLMSRFGSALRAAASSSKRTAPTVAKPNSAPPAPPAASATPAAPANVHPSTMEDCWAKFNQIPAYASLGKADREEAWFKLLQDTIGHVRQESATNDEWGRVMAALDSMEEVPF